MEQRTKGKWIQNGNNGIHTVEGRCIALTYMEDSKKQDAQFICKAVNAHDELVEALKDLIERADSCRLHHETAKAKTILQNLNETK